MKSAIERITNKRHSQIYKHGYDLKHDVKFNRKGQLLDAARILIRKNPGNELQPAGWTFEIWQRMISKPLTERLVIAAALIAAEIERLEDVACF